MGLELAVEVVEHNAGLDGTALPRDVEIEDTVKILRAIDDQAFAHRLPALRGAAAARQHRDALLARNRDRPRRIVHRARRDHAERHNLIMRGVGGITPAGEAVETDIARHLGFQPPLQPRPQSVSQTLLLPASEPPAAVDKALLSGHFDIRPCRLWA